MDTSAERKRMLLAMKDDIMEQFRSVKAKLDAVELLIADQDENDPGTPVATVEEVRHACIEILGDYGAPVHRQNLLEILEDKGVHVGGKVPVNNLGSILSRFSKDFDSHGQGMWSINIRPMATLHDNLNMNGRPPKLINEGYLCTSSLNEDYTITSS